MKPELEYPLIGGLPAPIDELDLPESTLNLKRRKNVTRHHRFFPADKYVEHVLFRTLRNLESMQDAKAPRDTHPILHSMYKPPKRPSPEMAVNEVIRAAKAGENMYIKYKSNMYIRKKIGENILNRVLEDYEQLRDKRNDPKSDDQE